MNRNTRRVALAPDATLTDRHASHRGSFVRATLAGLIAGLWLAAAPVQAQPALAHPAATETTPPALDYRSAFARYRPYADQGVSSWREANDGVGRIGGWRVYAREARQPDAAEPARSQPSTDVKAGSPTPSDAPTGRTGRKP